jgi:3-phenylpropionate/trans-cinnamate dioxygenase ferredoxin subunit
MASLVAVGRADEIPVGTAVRASVGDTPVAVFNAGGQFYVIGDTCTHEEASLSEGELVDEYTVECPLHGAQFDIRTGRALCLPATGTTGSFEVIVEGGVVKVKLPE